VRAAPVAGGGGKVLRANPADENNEGGRDTRSRIPAFGPRIAFVLSGLGFYTMRYAEQHGHAHPQHVLHPNAGTRTQGQKKKKKLDSGARELVRLGSKS